KVALHGAFKLGRGFDMFVADRGFHGRHLCVRFKPAERSESRKWMCSVNIRRIAITARVAKASRQRTNFHARLTCARVNHRLGKEECGLSRANQESALTRKVLVGPAGWSYADWAGIAYPAKRAREFRSPDFLARYFDTIEINTS